MSQYLINYDLPNTLYQGGQPIDDDELADKVAEYFNSKIVNLTSEAVIDEEIYNGTSKVNCESSMFMDPQSIKECIQALKSKNSEGFDRIPQRCLVDGVESLCTPFNGLFKRIYEQSTVPAQWLVSKTIPIFKNKGDKKDIENYRPIANLCSSSKIFEKLILKRIMDIQVLNDVDLTNNSQHGFKKNRSTTSLSLTIQTIIAQALEDDGVAL